MLSRHIFNAKNATEIELDFTSVVMVALQQI